MPITLPEGVSVQQKGDALKISGPKGELDSPVPPGITMIEEEHGLRFERANNEKQTRAYHGLARALAANAVQGVHEGFHRDLLIEGIGYRAKMEGKSLVLQLGFSHPVNFPVPDGIEINVEDQTKVFVNGIDKQQVGEIAAQIRRFRPPDAYKGKGIRYADEIVRKKVGKAGVSALGA
jgi:large subunit ribosomal protein L6|tara:strand:+ start:734 stop:1267 length:534 start_codon:yes stop_codon:yes gene_type:complete